VEGVLEELPIGPVGVASLLYFDEDDRLAWRIAESVIHATALDRVLGGHDAGIKNRPSERVEERKDYTL